MLFSETSIVEKYDYLNDSFKAAYGWLVNTDLQSIAVGKYPICDGVYAMVQEYNSHPADESFFEAHDDYFDIQYVISGKEQFGVCKRDGLKVRESFPEKDLVFFEEPELSGSVLLLPGDLIVVAPEDAHKPRICAAEPEFVRKVVIKVKV